MVSNPPLRAKGTVPPYPPPAAARPERPLVRRAPLARVLLGGGALAITRER